MLDIEPAVRRQLLSWYALAAAYGDALGASTEFLPLADAVKFTAANRDDGFPWTAVGGGWLGLQPGQHTDDTDMSLALIRCYIETGGLDPHDLAARWIGWLSTSPPDVGSTIRSVLSAIRAGADPFAASEKLFSTRPQAAANGALMRNAPCAPIATSLEQAFKFSLSQGLITHFHPLSVLCCGVHTWLLWKFLDGTFVFTEYRDWLERWHADWTKWLVGCKEKHVQKWLARVERNDALNDAMKTLCEADFDPDSFNPFNIDLKPQQGYVLLSLQIAIWATQWAHRPSKDVAFPVTPILKPVADVFARRGLHTIGWIPLLGHDADTYGAIAGPLISCSIGKPFSSEKTANLAVRKERWLFDDPD